METEITKYVSQQMMILIPTLWIVGMILKNLKFVADNYIPIILMFLGIMMATGLEGAFGINAIIQGILVSGCATGLHAGIKQVMKPDK